MIVDASALPLKRTKMVSFDRYFGTALLHDLYEYVRHRRRSVFEAQNRTNRLLSGRDTYGPRD